MAGMNRVGKSGLLLLDVTSGFCGHVFPITTTTSFNPQRSTSLRARAPCRFSSSCWRRPAMTSTARHPGRTRRASRRCTSLLPQACA
jgi:hypothetical protein